MASRSSEPRNTRRQRTATIRSTSHQICWIKISQRRAPIRNGLATSATSGPVRAGCILPSSLTCILAASSAGPLSGMLRKPCRAGVSNRMKKDLAIRALDMAVALRQPPEDCLHHTDRGSQYCSNEYQKRLSKHGFKVSMSGKGNCYDNSMVETFFKSIKAELIWRNRWDTRRQAEGAIFQYINGFYNPRRRHSSLGGKSPLAFERKAA